MSAEFFALAFLSALNPKLLALDLLLIENRRPRAMFVCVLLGGMTVALTVGLLDVLVFHADAIKAQGTVSAGVDLALGKCWRAAGALLATGRLHGRRPASVPAGDRPPDKPEKKDSWAQRALSELRLGLGLVGAVVGIPGTSYLTAVHKSRHRESSTATQVIAVVIFVIIDFLLILIPFAFLGVRPEATKALLKHAQHWLLGHALQLMATIALLLGAYPGRQRPGPAEVTAILAAAAPAAGQDAPNRLGFRARHRQDGRHTGNTLKPETTWIYGKLGITSCCQAVLRSRDLGFLEQ